MPDELTDLISVTLDYVGYKTSKENINAVYRVGSANWDWDQAGWMLRGAILDAIEMSAVAGKLERVDA